MNGNTATLKTLATKHKFMLMVILLVISTEHIDVRILEPAKF